MGTITASGFSARSMPITSWRWMSSSRSILLTSSTSQNSTWSTSRSATLRSSSSPRCSPFSRRSAASRRSRGKLTPSTTVTSVSRRATDDRLSPLSSSKVKVSATGNGSEMPVDSITRYSKRPSPASRFTSSSRSSRSVQQMQPLLISTSFSSARFRLTCSLTRLASMLISLMSLTITATRRSSRLLSMWLSTVVLPAPRNPDSTVTGRRLSTAVSCMMVLPDGDS